ncbi:protease, partial [Streptomyces drozdowiczii]|nr:protease [Streptomyces drozdowiczii]
MDDGKPTEPKAKWWSRPTAGPATAGEAPEPPVEDAAPEDASDTAPDSVPEAAPDT